MIDITQLTVDQAMDMIPDRQENWLKSNQAFQVGDHWQDGGAWTGPALDKEHPDAKEATQAISQIFAPDPVLNEAVERRRDAVLGRTLGWNITGPTKKLTSEAIELVTDWMVSRNVKRHLQQAVDNACWTKRGPMRVYIPSGLLVTEDGQTPTIPAGLDPKAALDLIYFERVDPTQATVQQEASTKRPVGIYTYADEDGKPQAEIVYKHGNKTIIYLAEQEGSAFELELKGMLPMHEIALSLMITEPLRRLQMKLNHASTAEQTNLATAGWAEDYFFNVAQPGAWETQTDANGEAKEVFTPDKIFRGPRTINWLVGEETTDEDGRQRIASPSHTRTEPSPPDTFIESADKTRTVILHRLKQGHVLLNESATSSGESRIKARGDFENSLADLKEEVDKTLVWLAATILQMAATFSGKPDYFSRLDIAADTKLDLGVITPKEKQAVRDDLEAGLISKRTAMKLIGIEDVDAELALITQEAEESQPIEP